VQGELQSNLNEIPALAAAAFDLPHKREVEMKEEIPLRIHAQIDQPLLTDFTWIPRIPDLLRVVPTRVARRMLRTLLETDFAAMLNSFDEAALALILSRLDEAITALAVSVDTRAGEIEARLIAAITGERPPRPAWQQGMLPPAEIGWGDAELDSARQRLLTVRGDIAEGSRDQEPALTRRMIDQPPAMPEKQPQSAVGSDFAKALETRGCPVCDHLIDTAWNFFADWQYAISTDEKSQERFAAEHGFCPLHTWQLIGLSSTTGSSVGFAKLVEHTSASLGKAPPYRVGPLFREIITTAATCRVCSLLHNAEADFVTRVAAFLDHPKNRELYSGSQGVCLRHLDLLIRASVSDDIADFLLKAAARRFEETAEDMRSFAMKRAATRRTLLNADESDAWLRAITHISGAQRYSTPPDWES
jgi:hypothetical protein